MRFVKRGLFSFASDRSPYREADESITFAGYIRLVIGVAADLSIVGWAVSYIGRSDNCPEWLAKTLAVIIFLLVTGVYFLTAKEFEALISKGKTALAKMSRFLVAFGIVYPLSVVPPIYGLVTGRPDPVNQQRKEVHSDSASSAKTGLELPASGESGGRTR